MTETAETVREFLDRKERELTNRISAAETSVNAMRAELEDVRRAKTALESVGTGIVGAQDNLLLPPGGAANVFDLNAGLGGLAALYGNPLNLLASASSNPLLPSRSNPYDRASIKQLILMALETSACRVYGATANEIRDFIRDAYGRDIERTSLSPQLSRLREDGFIDLHEGRWKRVDPNQKRRSPLYDKTYGSKK